jgi:hypothetical protein
MKRCDRTELHGAHGNCPGDDLKMMKSPNDWPQWPILPLVKGHHPDKQYGVLVECSDESIIWVPGATMYETINITDPRVVRVPDYQTLIKEGWRVD